MRSLSRLTVIMAPILMLSLGLMACGKKSPEERVAELRSYYAAELNGFIVQEEPLVDELDMPVEGVEPVAGEPGSEEGSVDEAIMAPVQVEQKVLLDILIRHKSPEKLSGITVDITMADPSGAEKGSWRAWFDTAGIEKANVTQFTHILEEIEYQEGDGFFVEVRHPVPAQDRGEYREFAATE